MSFLGGRSSGSSGGSSAKAPITIAVERLEGRRLGRVRLTAAEKVGGLIAGRFATLVNQTPPP